MSKAIAVILPNWIGDAVMATPALQCLRSWAGVDARIEGFGPPGVLDLLRGLPSLSTLHELPPRGFLPSRALALSQRLRAGCFDCGLLFSNGLGVAIAAWLGGIGERVGYDRRGRGHFLTNPLTPSRQDGRLSPVPAIDYYLVLVHALGAAEGRLPMALTVLPDDEAAAAPVWSVFADRREYPMVILNNNAARSEAKLWPVGFMADLAQQIAGAFDVNVLVLGAPGHEPRAAQTAQLAGHSHVRSATPSGLGPLKACLRHAALVVTTDSGVRAIAAAFGVPLISLFGPTDPRWTILHVANEIMIEERQHHRMASLPVERVWAAVQQRLGRTR